MHSFVLRHLDQINKEGWVALRRKAGILLRIFLKPCPINPARLLVIFIRKIRPLIVIRLTAVDVGRIGGTYHADWYLSEKADGNHRSRHLDFFYFFKSTDHMNRQWLKMWKRELPVVPFSKFVRNANNLNKKIPGYEEHLIPNDDVVPTVAEHLTYIAGKDLNVYERHNERLKCILRSERPNLCFTTIEEMRGARELKRLGIHAGDAFVCFHARDSAFLDAVKSDFNWRYHDYRDSSIQNYLSAAEEMSKRGYYAVRLGAKVSEKVISTNPRVIDYACNGMRTDFLDIYLSAKCRFILCSDTGMSFPAEVFKRPLVFVNWGPILRVPVYVLKGLVIFKKFYLKNENCQMTFSEIMSLKFGGADTNEKFAKMNLELIENTPEEICAVTVEMDQRLNGTWQTTKEDEELQHRFWALFGPDKLKSPDLRIGAEYLRQNIDLLE